jgi:hypothetical protein
MLAKCSNIPIANTEHILNTIRLIFISLLLVIAASTAAALSDDWRESGNDNCRAEDRYNKPMTFCYASTGGNAAGGEWISAEGEITQDTPDEFLKWLDETDISFRIRVYFNSPGGDLLAGLRLGAIIHKQAFNTGIAATVPVPDMEDYFMQLEELKSGQCYSACAYAFLGGVERSFFDGDLYGVRQFYDPPLPSDIENPDMPVATYRDLESALRMIGRVVRYVDKMGASPQLVALAAATSPVEGSGIRLLTVAEAKELDVINTKSDEPFRLTLVDGILTAQSTGYYLNRPIPRRVQCLGDTMAVFVSLPAGATVENWNGASLEIDLGGFTRFGTFQIMGPTEYENQSYTTYMLQIPVNEDEWPDIQRVGFLGSWPFNHAGESVSNGFVMGFGDTGIMSMIGQNCG